MECLTILHLLPVTYQILLFKSKYLKGSIASFTLTCRSLNLALFVRLTLLAGAKRMAGRSLGHFLTPNDMHSFNRIFDKSSVHICLCSPLSIILPSCPIGYLQCPTLCCEVEQTQGMHLYIFI